MLFHIYFWFLIGFPYQVTLHLPIIAYIDLFKSVRSAILINSYVNRKARITIILKIQQNAIFEEQSVAEYSKLLSSQFIWQYNLTFYVIGIILLDGYYQKMFQDYFRKVYNFAPRTS